jgi:hypothetical protein
VKDLFCERCVVCQRAKIQPQIAASLYPLLVPPRPWHTIGRDYLTRLLLSNGLDNVLIVVDHLTRMAHFCRVQKALLPRKVLICFYMESIVYMDCLVCWSLTVTRSSSVACGRHFGDVLERV